MKIITICLCILLISCTSEPLNVRYYLLHTPQKKVDTKSDVAKPIVVVQSLKIADYLRQSNLVLQVDEYELHYSRQDVWAEELGSSFYNALLQDLNTNSQRNYVASSSPEAIGATTTINIKLEHFHATDASTVVSSGRYWLSANDLKTAKNKVLATSSHSFYFESQLKQDGYSHAVEKLRTLVVNLANQIEKDIAALPNN
ncbi:PqiC family protein [Paraglaciecola arctica]|uniref:ABC-type transport auxiliary lipoprotein component domain-containing protein n=1 Tax=Paraglaciecola arctica BSs20135 TaxID=493475 RepID=K6YN34_9ALTE|nr:ABC-type transport auxiliary lipoprotein family protein [Paraglaciecola arctica]GAC18053.1 hypothetical protein GARC_1072 [Paraglaciecola arctica BSs20135]